MNQLNVVVTESNKSCGGVIYWSLSGVIRREALVAAWEKEGLDAALLPQPTSPERALRAAVDELRDRTHIVRPLPDGSGYSIVAEQEVDGKRADYAQTLRAFIEADGSIKIEPSGHPDAERVLDAYDLALGSVIDGGGLLVRTCRRLGSVTLHDKGGIYFVPSTKMPELESVVRAVEACSAHRVWCLPAMRSDEAARAVLAAISEEAEKTATTVERELGQEGDDALGAKAIGNRQGSMRALRAKVEEYERLMGGSLADVRDRLEKLQAALAAAALAAEAAEQEAA